MRHALLALEPSGGSGGVLRGGAEGSGGGGSDSGEGSVSLGWRLPWSECRDLAAQAQALRAMFVEADLCVRTAALHFSIGEAAAARSLALLQLNMVAMELALGEYVRAEALVQSFVRHGVGGEDATRALWRLYELALYAAAAAATADADAAAAAAAAAAATAAGSVAPARLPLAPCARVQSLWETRLKQTLATGGGARLNSATQYECWHAFVLSSAQSRRAARHRSPPASHRPLRTVRRTPPPPDACGPSTCRSHAMQLIALAAIEHSVPEDADAAALRLSNSPTFFEPTEELAAQCTALLQRLVLATSVWGATLARERLYLHLLWLLWLQLIAPPSRVNAGFEALLEAGVLPPSLRPLAWLRFVHWASLPASGCSALAVLRLQRRSLAEVSGAPPSVEPAAAPSAAPQLAVAAAVGTACAASAASAGEGEAPWVGEPYDEAADTELRSVLRTEPLASFFRAAPHHAAPHEQGEALCLGVRLCTPRAPHPRPALAPAEQMPTTLRLLLAARAVAAADLQRARTLLATAWPPPRSARTHATP